MIVDNRLLSMRPAMEPIVERYMGKWTGKGGYEVVALERSRCVDIGYVVNDEPTRVLKRKAVIHIARVCTDDDGAYVVTWFRSPEASAPGMRRKTKGSDAFQSVRGLFDALDDEIDAR